MVVDEPVRSALHDMKASSRQRAGERLRPRLRQKSRRGIAGEPQHDGERGERRPAPRRQPPAVRPPRPGEVPPQRQDQRQPGESEDRRPQVQPDDVPPHDQRDEDEEGRDVRRLDEPPPPRRLVEPQEPPDPEERQRDRDEGQDAQHPRSTVPDAQGCRPGNFHLPAAAVLG
jgi:hypothetical protein